MLHCKYDYFPGPSLLCVGTFTLLTLLLSAKEYSCMGFRFQFHVRSLYVYVLTLWLVMSLTDNNVFVVSNSLQELIKS